MRILCLIVMIISETTIDKFSNLSVDYRLFGD